MAEVLLTIDTEVEPCLPEWRSGKLSAEVEQYIDGRTPAGDFGLEYQLSVLRRHRLRAVFFVEALFGLEVGRPVLERVVSRIREEGHEVQLHLHTEWLTHLQNSPLPGRTGPHMRSFSEDEQTRLLEAGIRTLERAGASGARAFRAGNYGADFSTLRALARSGLRYDSSWNAAYLGGSCRLDTLEPLLSPRLLDGVWEVPIAFLEDYPGHYRHAELCACSYRELREALEHASAEGWPSFVVVSHSFEFVWLNVKRRRPARPRRLVIRRFEKLCRYLDENRDRLPTVGFTSLQTASPPRTALRPPSYTLARTAARLLEQALGRLI